MRLAISLVAMLLLAPSTVIALQESTFLSVNPSDGKYCIDVFLPQDLGVSSVSMPTESVIEAENTQWIDTTYKKTVMNRAIMSRSPICFDVEKPEGSYTFYTIKITSRDIDFSRDITGGICLSSLEDADEGNRTGNANVCDIINENADLFDIGFLHDVEYAAPGSSLEKALILTTYANLNIDVNFEFAGSTQARNVRTVPENPFYNMKFSVKSPSQEGEYTVKAMAKVKDCSLALCTKETESKLIVSSTGVSSGTEAAVFPRNINLKTAQDAYFRVVLSNYGSETETFEITPGAGQGVRADPETAAAVVNPGEEQTVTFKITPPAKQGLYKLFFRVTTASSEKMLEAYLSVGELLTDAVRQAGSLKNQTTNQTIKNEIDNALKKWTDSDKASSYGKNLDSYQDFKDSMDDAQKKIDGSESPGNETDGGENPQQGFNWIIVIIPVAIVLALLVFYLFRKSSVSEPVFERY